MKSKLKSEAINIKQSYIENKNTINTQIIYRNKDDVKLLLKKGSVSQHLHENALKMRSQR